MEWAECWTIGVKAEGHFDSWEPPEDYPAGVAACRDKTG
jgi:hypothetical protein